MSKFTYRVSLPELDDKKFTKAVQDACRKALMKAAREFLLAAIPKVPIFTGFARGAFGNLEDLVGRVSVSDGVASLNYRQKGVKKASYYQKKKYYYYPPKGEKVIRNTITGRKFATKPTEVFSKGKARVSETDKVFFFRFSIDITYFNLLDKNKWHAFSSGIEAFNTTLRSEFDALKPKVGKYLVKREVK